MKTAVSFLACFAVCAYVFGQNFEITRSTIDSGGVMRSTGGAFELSGTIGQPDAGVMTGGDFQLTGGFWFEVPPGDCDEDGSANLVDHDFFTGCLGGPNSGVLSGCDCTDLDNSGHVDLRDFALTSNALISN